jgi:hypothetical protein
VYGKKMGGDVSMVNVNEVLERYGKLGVIGRRDILDKISVEERLYKCHTCYNIVDKSPCPNCNEKQLAIMCPLDHCHCSHDIMTALAHCPLCGEPICPECGCHDVSQVSRVTGYLADVGGFNAGKRQELKDRTRYTIG